MGIETTINKDLKSKGGISGVSLNKGATERYASYIFIYISKMKLPMILLYMHYIYLDSLTESHLELIQISSSQSKPNLALAGLTGQLIYLLD